jgi:hypothetical protein
VRADGLDGIYNRRAPTLKVANRTGASDRSLRPRRLTLGNPTSQPNEIVGDMKSVSGNISRSFVAPVPTVLKVGFSINRQRKDNTSVLKTWTFAPPAGVSRLVGGYDLINPTLSQQSFFNDTLKMKWVIPRNTTTSSRRNPEWFTTNDAATYQSGVTNSKYFKKQFPPPTFATTSSSSTTASGSWRRAF